MSLKTSASRYARALFDVALQDGDLAQIDHDLTTVAEVVAHNADALQPVLRHGVPEDVRRRVIDAVVSALGLGNHVRKLLGVLVAAGRLELLPLVAESYRERLLSHQNIVRAQVMSAVPLDPESVKALQESLGRATGKTVELSMSVDRDLIGGVVARIGSTIYDGSVKTQLTKIRQTLVG